MAGCRPARREPANLPAGIAGAGRLLLLLGPGRDRWLVSAEARLLWQRQPRPGKRPVSPRRRPALHTSHGQNNQRVAGYKTRKDGRCRQCVGDSPVLRRGSAGYVGVQGCRVRGEVNTRGRIASLALAAPRPVIPRRPQQ